MKLFSTLVAGLLALTAAPVLAQTTTPGLQALDDSYGFRGARFEADTSAFQDLVLAETAGQTRYYRRTSEPRKLGEADVADITYGFYQGKLSVVLLKTRGAANSRAALAALQQKAGPGQQNSPFSQRYAWNGKRVHLSYDENALSNDAVIILTCKKIKQQEIKRDLRTRPTTPPPSGS